MKAKELFTTLSKWTWARFRSVNIKLIGNKRWGFYKELNINDTLKVIEDIGKFTQSPHNTTSAESGSVPLKEPTLRTGSNFAILSRLCEQYYVYEGSDRFKKKIIDEVAEIIEELRCDATATQELEAMLDALHNNLMQDFRRAYPSFQEKDYQLYAYLAAHFSATTIAVLSGKEKSVIYNRISRLKRSIKENNKHESERFLSVLL